jgi:hypothetical protein
MKFKDAERSTSKKQVPFEIFGSGSPEFRSIILASAGDTWMIDRMKEKARSSTRLRAITKKTIIPAHVDTIHFGQNGRVDLVEDHA